MSNASKPNLRPTALHIDLDALGANFKAIRQKAGPERRICAVVKANAYGHGATIVSRRLQKLGCDHFGVALVEEAVELRRAGIEKPIVVLGAVAGEEGIRAAVEHDIEIAVHNFELLPAVAKVCAEAGRPVRVHLKVETGMGRLGVMPSRVGEWCGEAARSGLELVGVYTTFSSADAANSDRTPRQLERFLGAIEKIKGCGFDPPMLHAANSGAVLNFPESLLTMLRPGLVLLGVPPARGRLGEPFKPIASLRTCVAQVGEFPEGYRFGYSGSFAAVRPSRIAVLPAGYADGVNRLLDKGGEVLIGGRRAPVVGRVSMDLVTVDVTDLPPVNVGDEAVLLGRQGDEEISAWEIAERVGTIPWEVFCWIGDRVPRLGFNGGSLVDAVSRFASQS